jgi:hypothetical protein
MNYFASSASCYISEHKANASRWDLVNVYNMTRRLGITFNIVGSQQDRFEFKSLGHGNEFLDGKDGIRIENFS